MVTFKPYHNFVFRENQNVIVIGATNLKNVIDPALLRPGRFDLTIDVPHPSKEGREEILNYYFSKGTVQFPYHHELKAFMLAVNTVVNTGSNIASLGPNHHWQSINFIVYNIT